MVESCSGETKYLFGEHLIIPPKSLAQRFGEIEGERAAVVGDVDEDGDGGEIR